MKKIDVVINILGDNFLSPANVKSATGFAPSNIALCKYWGKRNEELHLPYTDSLSISLNSKGSETKISLSNENSVIFNGNKIEQNDSFASKIFDFIYLFSHKNQNFLIDINCNIPVAAGLASSAAGFAALTLALNKLYCWNLSKQKLSIFARLGSGSATRSVSDGFVLWKAGIRDDGMDSYSKTLPYHWNDLLIGLIKLSDKKKSISSRVAMRISKEKSPIFNLWRDRSNVDLNDILIAIKNRDFLKFGSVLEGNSEFMHKIIQSSKINYSSNKTQYVKKQILSLREDFSIPVFYTQDAGANLVIFFEKENIDKIINVFPMIDIITPFA